jgi:hypothetical protein
MILAQDALSLAQIIAPGLFGICVYMPVTKLQTILY